MDVCRAVCRIMVIFQAIYRSHRADILRLSKSESGVATPTHRRSRSLTNSVDGTEAIVSTPSTSTTGTGGRTTPPETPMAGHTPGTAVILANM